MRFDRVQTPWLNHLSTIHEFVHQYIGLLLYLEECNTKKRPIYWSRADVGLADISLPRFSQIFKISKKNPSLKN